MSKTPFAHAPGFYTFAPQQTAEIANAARQQALPALSASLAACPTLPQALRHLGEALAFPDWYGSNLDALYDCLCDPDWQPGNSLVLMLLGTAHLSLSDPKGFASLSEVLQAAAETRCDNGQRCWLLLDSPVTGIQSLPEA